LAQVQALNHHGITSFTLPITTMWCRAVILAATLLGHSHALRLMQTKNTDECSLPKDLEWGMVIDGKDADKGPDAYTDPNKNEKDKDSFHDGPLKALRLVHETTSAGSEELSMKIVKKIHGECCSQYASWRGHSNHTGHTLDCIQKIEDPTLRMMGTKGINKGYIQMIGKKAKDGSYKDYTRGNPAPVEKHLEKLIGQYNEKVRGASTDDEKITALSNFLRNMAWLHSWHGGNGRIRNLLFQREIRRLGLGCGAMMYNNNRDIFYVDDEIYSKKIREGLDMYKQSESLKLNAWTVQANKDAHRANFVLDPQMVEVCQFKNEKLGSIE